MLDATTMTLDTWIGERSRAEHPARNMRVTLMSRKVEWLNLPNRVLSCGLLRISDVIQCHLYIFPFKTKNKYTTYRVAFAVTVPAGALTGRLTPVTHLSAAGLTVLLPLLARGVWRLGVVRNDTGASA